MKQDWGYDGFRPLQLDIIESVGSGKDTLGLMPTGGGKSLTFQVPTMAMDGVCLVITPLIALMKDQVEQLKRLGINAAAIYSGMSHQQILQVLENCEFGAYKFLYLSPERLGTELFKKRVVWLKIAMIAIDEAHCISQWGYDFRPSYLKIAEIRELVPNVPVLALTATATPKVVDDIQEHLSFPKKNLFKKSFYRENLAYVVRHSNDKLMELLRIINKVPGSAVVYVRNRKKCVEITQLLHKHQVSANFYHAGIPDKEKYERQMSWKTGQTRIMVATNAFGMGIDKPDVRLVVHVDIPDTIEAYFQEAGRAGRDGEKAYAVMLYNSSDDPKLKKRISDNFPEKEMIRKVYQSLAETYLIGEGDGMDTIHPFEIDYFCRTWHLPVLQSFSAIKIMELSGVAELTEEQESPSKLRFIMNREALYNLKLERKFFEEVIEVLLRKYTGILNDLVNINEDDLAEKLHCGRQEVYDALSQMQRMHIVQYVPFKKVPLFIYRTPRQNSEKLYIARHAYEERRERFEKRIYAMLDYVTEEQICRSQQLLHYFGEDTKQACGICDVCVGKRKPLTITKKIDVKLKEKLLALLADGESRKVEWIVNAVDGPSDMTLNTLRTMINDEFLIYHEEERVISIKKPRNK